MITYLWKERIEHDDLLNTVSLRVIKYGLFVFYIVGALALAANHSVVSNDDIKPIHYVTQFTSDFVLWDLPWVMIGIGSFYLVLIISVSLYYSNARQ